MFSTIGKLLPYMLNYVIVLCGISVISKQLNCIPFSSSRFFNSSHWIHFCYPIITYIIILYKQKKNQSKYKVKVPVLTLIFKSFLCIVLYPSRRCYNISSLGSALFCSYRSFDKLVFLGICSIVCDSIYY